MFDEFATGMTFPRPEDQARLDRYDEADKLYEGKHYNADAAKRLRDKLNQSRQYTQWNGLSAEGVVALVLNLPRLVCDKFADLQVLQTPAINLLDDKLENDFSKRLDKDVPELWATIHEALSRKRGFGDCGLTVSISAEDNGRALDIRVVDPRKWYPVLDPNDPLRVIAHQIAWVEDVEDGKTSKPYLRVDLCTPNRVERRAFRLEGRIDPRQDNGHQFEIKEQVSLDTHWPGLPEVDTADMGGLMSFVHLANGHLRAGEIFGRPEFIDSGALIDDINWRLSAWSDANDKVSHPPRIVPKSYITQTEEGAPILPSRYTSEFIGSGRGDGEGNVPQYMTFELVSDTLEHQFEVSLKMFFVRHELAPALLGLQVGAAKESGEAKALGMGTTEAATRRDLLQIQPKVNRVLTAAARLVGLRDVDVTTHWRVGLPKGQAELMAELAELRRLGLVTRKDMLETLRPWYSEAQIMQKLKELDEERQADMDALTSQLQPEMG